MINNTDLIFSSNVMSSFTASYLNPHAPNPERLVILILYLLFQLFHFF